MSKRDGAVTAVVVNYNGGDAVLKCLDSLAAQTYAPLKVVVVDNLSKDGSADRIAEAHPGVRLIRHPVNSGWGVACNIGMEGGDSEFVAFVNNDAWLEKDCVEQMVKAIRLKPEYGSCATKILTADGAKLEVCGLNVVADGSSCGRGRLRPIDLYPDMEEVFCANDCCCLYRREMVEDIGGYDPDFFIYCDETDMGFRHQMAGWKCVYAPAARAYHAHSLTAGSYSPFKAFHVERNRILLVFKYFPFHMMPLAFALSAWRFGLQAWIARSRSQGALARYLEEHSWADGIRVLAQAHWAALKMAPRMLRRRRGMRKINRIGLKGFKNLFARYGITVRQMAAYE